MKRFSMIMTMLIAAAASASVASAQEPQPGAMNSPGAMRYQMPSFGDLDKNKDKKISRDEFPGMLPPQAFDRLDENKDGFIDEEEFGRSRGRMMGGPRSGETLTKYMDANRDSKVSRDEFAKITQIFDALDADKSGDLSQEELNRFFQAINETQTQATGGVDVNNLFQNTDKNKDGKLTTDEMTDERLFKALDLNKDGSVPRDEAEQALKQINERRQRRQSQPQTQNN